MIKTFKTKCTNCEKENTFAADSEFINFTCQNCGAFETEIHARISRECEYCGKAEVVSGLKVRNRCGCGRSLWRIKKVEIEDKPNEVLKKKIEDMALDKEPETETPDDKEPETETPDDKEPEKPDDKEPEKVDEAKRDGLVRELKGKKALVSAPGKRKALKPRTKKKDK